MLNCCRNTRFPTLLGAVAILLCGSPAAFPAQGTTNSPTPASAASPTASSTATPVPVVGASPTPATTQSASLEDRVASLEAYINNTDGTKTLPGVPGPGHNAWMMTSSALVLFMTLPGLALFYGGLVRRKNMLSVMAQCLGCAGLVTILWWAAGYSIVFSSGTPFFGSLKFAMFKGV